MPPLIIPVLDRLRQDISATLTPEAIEHECRRAGHAWRARLLGPATTIYLFLLQVLNGNTTCRHVVHFGRWSFSDSAYCQARKRIPLAVYHALLQTTADAVRSTTAAGSRWLGHRVWIVDGSSFSMPDRPELQRHFGQPGNQRPGATAGTRGTSGLPRSRWIAALGQADQVVAWSKPASGPSWMAAEEYARLPEEIAVRELRYRVEARGYRTGEITLVTTLLDGATYPASSLAELYYKRWQVELNFRHMKIRMKMDVLRCETVDGVLKELAMFALAYILVRSVMAESARLRGIDADRIGLLDALRWLLDPEGVGDVSLLVVNPDRRGRVEPRVVKRRPKQYMRMMEPRANLRKKLPMKGF